MATVARKEAIGTKVPLQAVLGGGWLGGFGNLLRKELGQWWGTRTWWIQTLIWLVLLNGITTIIMLTESLPAGEMQQEVVRAFLSMSVVFIAIGTIIAAQGAVVGEKELGTAAWVMSKPASRSAFILAKVVAYAVGFWVTAILVPSALFVVTAGQLADISVALRPFLAAMAVVALGQLFYLALTLMLGTYFNSRGPVAGIGIAVALGGMLLKGLVPMAVLMVTPWPFDDLSGALAAGLALPENWYLPIVATGGWTVVMIAVALWRFGREEF